MRPILSVADPALLNRIIDEARHILATTGMEIRGPALRTAPARRRAAGHRGWAHPLPRRRDRSGAGDGAGSFTLFDRDGKPHAEIGGDHVHFTPGSSGLKVQDHRSGRTRDATTADFVEYVRLCDGLEHVRYLATAFSTGDDIEPGVSDAWRLLLCLTNSTRPIVSGAFTEHGVPRMVEMMQLFRRDRADLIARPCSIFTITATGNFRYSEDSCQNLLDCVEAGIPVEIVPVTLMGLTAPVTLVGAAVFHAVDTLAGVVMAQIVRPGRAGALRRRAGGVPHARDDFADAGRAGAFAGCAQRAGGRRLGLPVQAYMGLSDAKELDAQAGAESFGSALLAALAGVNSVSGPGMLDFVLVFSLPKLVFDNEVCGQALQLVRPLQVADDLPTHPLVKAQLADLHLITAPHTLAHWEEQLYLPGAVYDRKNREAWERDGEKSLWQRAVDEVEQRLAAYTPVATDPLAVAELERILRSGMRGDAALPAIPDWRSPGSDETVDGRRQRRFRR